MEISHHIECQSIFVPNDQHGFYNNDNRINNCLDH